jgi:alpha-1,6-mannosyltransferase
MGRRQRRAYEMIKSDRAREPSDDAAGDDAAGYATASLAVPLALFTIGAAMAWFGYWGKDLHRFNQWVAAYIGIFVGQLAMYAIACWVVLSFRSNRFRAVSLSVLGVVIFFAIIFRVTLAGERPYLSSDIYRYIWDGRVQAAGINPYRHPPKAEELSFLEDDKIYRNINPDDLQWPSPYPPAAQAIFFAVYSIRPSSFTAFKLAMSLFDIITILALMLALARSGLDPARAIIFAWHPLPIYEGAHSGHLESAYIAFLALALLAWTYRKYTATGVALALATLVKLYPALLLPVFLVVQPSHSTQPPLEESAGRKNRLGRAWLLSRVRGLFNKANLKMLFAFAVTLALTYLPYLSAGAKVFSFLGLYIEGEGFVEKGTRYYLLTVARRLVPLPTSVFLIIAVAALGTLTAWWMIRVKRDGKDVARGAMALIGLYLILTTPRYSWYYAWLIPYLCFIPRAGWLYLTSASVLLYLLWYTPLVYPDIPMWLGAVIYFPALAWLAIGERVRGEG